MTPFRYMKHSENRIPGRDLMHLSDKKYRESARNINISHKVSEKISKTAQLLIFALKPVSESFANFFQ